MSYYYIDAKGEIERRIGEAAAKKAASSQKNEFFYFAEINRQNKLIAETLASKYKAAQLSRITRQSKQDTAPESDLFVDIKEEPIKSTPEVQKAISTTRRINRSSRRGSKERQNKALERVADVAAPIVDKLASIDAAVSEQVETGYSTADKRFIKAMELKAEGRNFEAGLTMSGATASRAIASAWGAAASTFNPYSYYRGLKDVKTLVHDPEARRQYVGQYRANPLKLIDFPAAMLGGDLAIKTADFMIGSAKTAASTTQQRLKTRRLNMRSAEFERLGGMDYMFFGESEAALIYPRGDNAPSTFLGWDYPYYKGTGDVDLNLGFIPKSTKTPPDVDPWNPKQIKTRRKTGYPYQAGDDMGLLLADDTTGGMKPMKYDLPEFLDSDPTPTKTRGIKGSPTSSAPDTPASTLIRMGRTSTFSADPMLAYDMDVYFNPNIFERAPKRGITPPGTRPRGFTGLFFGTYPLTGGMGQKEAQKQDLSDYVDHWFDTYPDQVPDQAPDIQQPPSGGLGEIVIPIGDVIEIIDIPKPTPPPVIPRMDQPTEPIEEPGYMPPWLAMPTTFEDTFNPKPPRKKKKGKPRKSDPFNLFGEYRSYGVRDFWGDLFK